LHRPPERLECYPALRKRLKKRQEDNRPHRNGYILPPTTEIIKTMHEGYIRMKTSRKLIEALTLVAAAMGCGGYAAAQDAAVQFSGAQCGKPPVMHCPDKDCPGDRVINQGPVVESKTRRTYFLDYPCDLKAGEKVTFVLSLHGGGSYGNWQRHYFPVMDFKEQYRLIVATPNAPTRSWAEADDEYLRNIVRFVYGEAAKNKVEIKAFWLAGHSFGGQTSNRLINEGFFSDRLTGWVSIAGGRLGSKREEVRAGIPGRAGPAATPPPARPAPSAAPGGAAGGGGPLAAYAEILPRLDFSHIYVTGEHELTPAGMPKTSPWADKLKCGKRVSRPQIADTKAGYVFDGSSQQNPNKVWGTLPRPGNAEMHVYPNCQNGHVVADVIRLDKGHTEGLEPNVTEEIIKLMMSATK
jgi:poly(3-hydroxybutyrate) depolymerase